MKSIDHIILDFATFCNASTRGYRLGLVDTTINIDATIGGKQYTLLHLAVEKKHRYC